MEAGRVTLTAEDLRQINGRGTEAHPHRRPVAILDADPDLARHMDPARAKLARRHVIAAVETVSPGPWRPDATTPDLRAGIGLLVLSGLLSRDLKLGASAFTELIGEGEVLRPWDDESGIDDQQDPEIVWTALLPAQVAILDQRFLARAARWPEITAAMVGRAIRRAQSLSFQVAICHLQRVEQRLLLLLWQLASRFGKVTSQGIVLPLPLTHRTLAALVGARRPTVTTALGQLAEEGKIARRPDGSWVLHGDAPPELREMYASLG